MDKNVDGIHSKYFVWTKTQIDILSKSQYGQKRRGYPL